MKYMYQDKSYYQLRDNCKKTEIIDIFFEYLGERPTIASCIATYNRIATEKSNLEIALHSAIGSRDEKVGKSEAGLCAQLEVDRLYLIMRMGYDSMSILHEVLNMVFRVKYNSVMRKSSTKTLTSKETEFINIYSQNGNALGLDKINLAISKKLVQECYDARLDRLPRGKILCI